MDEHEVAHLVGAWHLEVQRRRGSRVVRAVCGPWVILPVGAVGRAWAGCRDCRLRGGIADGGRVVRSVGGRLVVLL